MNAEKGLTYGEVETCRKEHGYIEVAEQEEHPVLKYLGNSGAYRRGCLS